MTHAALPASPADPAVLLEGASNFRDLGGLPAGPGWRVRPGRVYRSDHLGRLVPADRERLRALGVAHSVDLRGTAERALTPYDIPGVTVEHLGIEPTVVRRLQALQRAGQAVGRAEAVAVMNDTYRDFVSLHAPVFGRLLARLAGQASPLVFHCTAGKDRTGVAAALLLGLLGVHRDDVMADYLLTNERYRREPRLEDAAPAEVLNVLWSVQPVFLQTAWDCIDGRFGGLEAYLAGPVGLAPAQQARLRERLRVAA